MVAKIQAAVVTGTQKLGQVNGIWVAYKRSIFSFLLENVTSSNVVQNVCISLIHNVYSWVVDFTQHFSSICEPCRSVHMAKHKVYWKIKDTDNSKTSDRSQKKKETQSAGSHITFLHMGPQIPMVRPEITGSLKRAMLC